MPPPAPARAWATLSFCGMGVLEAMMLISWGFGGGREALRTCLVQEKMDGELLLASRK